MNYKFLLIFILIFTTSCINEIIDKDIKTEVYKKKFSNKGFALVYNNNLYENKIIDGKIETRSFLIFQKNLKKDTTVRITNLINSKYIVAKVGSDKIYPFFYNSVISERIAEELKINKSEPYIEIVEILQGSSFIAKKAKIFEEEKKVASKAPIVNIKIKDLSNNNAKKKKKTSKRKFNYIIKIADFYFKKSAIQMKKRILNETIVKKVYINKLSDTKFRVFLGPHKNLNSLKKSFNAINVLEFDSIEIIKN